MLAPRPVVPALRSSFRIAVACLALAAAAPSAAAAQGLLPLVSYTFAGCFEVGGCHTARVVVGRADPILNFRGVDPSLNGMLFGVSHSLPAGTALAVFGNPFPYGILSPTGTRIVWDDDDIYRGGASCPYFGYPTTTRTCDGGFSALGEPTGAPIVFGALAGWTSSDWSPTHFVVRVTLGAPGAAVFPDDEQRMLLLPLVSTQAFNVVPEPSTVALLGGGLAVLGAYVARRRRARA